VGKEEDRYIQFMAERAKPPPLMPGDTLHWDGGGAVSQDVELTQGSEPVACPVFRSTGSWQLDLLPAPPARAIHWAEAAAALTFYLDSGMLLASVCTVLPGVTGSLRWLRRQGDGEFLTPAVHPVLLVQTASASRQEKYVELVPHLPLYDPLLYHIAAVLQAVVTGKGVAGQLYAEVLANALADHLLRRYAAGRQSAGALPGGLTPFKLRRTVAYIQAHLERELPLVELAAIAQTSSSHFTRLFKQATGRTPHQYVLWCRMEQAKRLLIETDVPLIEIAYQVGCTDQSHFTALFRQHVATTPKAYRDAITRT